MIDMLGDATNYVEMEASNPDGPGRYLVRVQRAGGETPHALRQEAENRARALEKERDAARTAVSSAGDAVAFSPRDWGVDHRDAWIYGILLGWSCEEDHDHDDVCGGDTALTEMAERHRWDAATVAKLREHRAALASHGQTHGHYEDQPRPCRAPTYGPDWAEAAHCDRPTGHTGWHSTENSVVEWDESTTTAPTHGGHDE